MFEKGSWTTNLTPLILALLSVTSIALLQRQDLHSGRPSENPASLQQAKFANGTFVHLEMPLWDDPLKVLKHEGNKNPDPVESLAAVCGLLKVKPTIFVVTLPAGENVITVEDRRRIRYAVQAAMRAANLTPEGTTLGLLDLRPAPDDEEDVDPAEASPWIVPYEWFHEHRQAFIPSGASEYHPVLVLWMSEACIEQDSSTFLSTLKAGLSKFGNPNAVMFGPWSSDTLLALCAGAAMYDRDREDASFDEDAPSTAQGALPVPPQPDYVLPIYAYSPTASDNALHAEWQNAKRFLQYFHTTFTYEDWRTHYHVHRTIPTDDELCKELLKELVRRNVPLTLPRGSMPTPPQIVLITEWDTFYGRAIKTTFESMLAAYAKSQNSDPVRVDWYPYFSKLDLGSTRPDGSGSSSGGPAAGGPDASLNPDAVKEKSSALAPRAYGEEQLDYLSRLADKVNHLESGVHVQAVGVFGSDVFDKLSLLRAMREKFPGAVFFTTDLDARLLEPTNRRWTRNLIVASSFGLNLPDSEEAQQNGWTAPFRSSYQTSLFSAVLEALNKEGFSDYQPPKDARAHIFEIGRYSAVELTPDQNPSDYNPGGQFSTHIWGRTEILILSTVMGVFSFGLAWWLRSRIQDYNREIMLPMAEGAAAAQKPISAWAWPLFWIVCCWAMPVAFWGVIQVDTASGKGEPWNLSEGISLWPTQALRMIAVFLCVYFMVMIGLRLRTMRARLNRRFGLNAARADAVMGDGAAQEWNRFTNHLLSRWFWICAIVLGVGLGWLFHYWVLRLDHPFIPARGTIITGVNYYLMMGCTMALMALLLIVGMVTAFSTRFIRNINQSANFWPWETYWKNLIGAQNFPQRAIPASGSSELQALAQHGWLRFLDPLYDVRFIGDMTGFTSEFVIYPFIVLVIVLISRLSVLDQFDWTPTYVLAVIFTFGFALSIGIVMRAVAENRRDRAIRYFRQLSCSCESLELLDNKDLQQQIPQLKDPSAVPEKIFDIRRKLSESAISEIERLEGGAFSPFSHNPIVWAVLTPLTGVGGANLIQYFLQ